MGGFDVGRVDPIWTMATFVPWVSLASTLPIRFGLGMKPYAFWWCSLVQRPSNPDRGRVQELVERPVVVLAHAAGVGQLPPWRRHPDGLVALLEVRRQLPVRHQVERADLHAAPFDTARPPYGAGSRRCQSRPRRRACARRARPGRCGRRAALSYAARGGEGIDGRGRATVASRRAGSADAHRPPHARRARALGGLRQPLRRRPVAAAGPSRRLPRHDHDGRYRLPRGRPTGRGARSGGSRTWTGSASTVRCSRRRR